MEFSICRVNQSDLDELTAVEAVCFPKEEAATREAFAARLDAFGNWFFAAKDENGKIIGMIDGMATNEESIDDAMFEDALLHREDGEVQTIFGWMCFPRGEKGALRVR